MKQLLGLLNRPYRPRSGPVTGVAWATKPISPCASRFTGGVHYNSCLGVSNYMCVRRWVHKGRGERRARASGGATRSSGRLARVAWSGVVADRRGSGRVGDRGEKAHKGSSWSPHRIGLFVGLQPLQYPMRFRFYDIISIAIATLIVTLCRDSLAVHEWDFRAGCTSAKMRSCLAIGMQRPHR